MAYFFLLGGAASNRLCRREGLGRREAQAGRIEEAPGQSPHENCGLRTYWLILDVIDLHIQVAAHLINIYKHSPRLLHHLKHY